MNKIIDKKEWLSLARAISIIAVILLHVSAPILNKYNTIPQFYWYIGNAFDSLVRFSVPLFFMLSGALLLSKDYKLKIFFKKRFKKIIPPFLFWSLFYLVYNRLINYKTFETALSYDFLKVIKRGLFEGSHFHFWFIYTIMGLYLFVPILRKWVKNSTKNEILYFLIIWFVTLLLRIDGINYLIPSIDLINFSGYIGYFVLGYYLNMIEINSKKLSALLFFIGFIITLFGTNYFTIKKGSFDSLFYKYLSPNVLIASIGMFLLLKNTSINNSLLKRIILNIDKNTFGIYFLHVFIIYLFNYFGISWNTIHPLIAIPLMTLGVLFVSNFIIELLKMNTYTKLIAG